MVNSLYQAKLLRINLTTKSASIELIPKECIRDFIGGAGLGIKTIFDEVPADTDPFSPDNKLVFAVGPFTGTSVPCASRMAIAGKSPLTNTIGLSMTGGYFPVEMVYAGFIALILEGKADKPTYVAIKDGAVSFKKADKVWGTLTGDCQQIIKDSLHDQNYRVACIGPAGENLSKIAGIFNERRTAGRKGFGAVMGAKNCKAIAIRGSGSAPVASPELYKKALRFMKKCMKDSPVLYPVFAKHGTSRGIDGHGGIRGIFPAKNFTATGEFIPVDKLGVEARASRKIGQENCAKCPVRCGQLNIARTGRYAGTLTEGPEYETIYSFGGQTGVDNLDSVIVADRLADEYGIDSMSAGVAIGFAMELYEKGILTKKETGGVALNFGNDEAMLDLIRLMSLRQGLGELLADGVRIAAEKIEQNSDQYAMHVKGLELPGYDVRGAKAHGLNYATSFTGADHNRGYAIQELFGHTIPFPADRFDYERKGELTKWNQDIRSATCDCATMCAFVLDTALAPNALQNTASLMTAVTNIDFEPESILKVGERINNLARAFNIRAGFGRADDTLPNRLMTESIKAGPSKGHTIHQEDFDTMLDEYYNARGWDLKEGVPTKKKLKALNLEYVIEYLNL
jgi:aldehyde:ferredoxin oxidoreductase